MEGRNISERYIVFDVVTPNYANDRISAIGISVIENGHIVHDFYTLVNPEVHFDSFNIQFTGITPETVEDKPAFPALWEEIQPLMDYTKRRTTLNTLRRRLWRRR